MKKVNLTAKMVAHVLGGSWAKIGDLEGNSSLNSLQFLIDYLPEAHNLQKQLNFTKDLMEKIDVFSTYYTHDYHKVVQHVIKDLHVAVNGLTDSSEDMIIISGGWLGLPRDDAAGISKHTGHEIYYVIKADPGNAGKFIFEVINAGAGLDYHDHKITDQGRKKYSFLKKWNNLDINQINLTVEKLLLPIIKPLTYDPSIHNSIEREDYYYDEHSIYKILNDNLPKENIIKTSDWITPQRIGNCSWKALMMVMRDILGKDQYKIFIHDLKFNALENLLNNLLQDPNQYGEYHFFMIKALYYGAQKIAKTLEKRKNLFTAEKLAARTKQINNLLKQAANLKKDYLKKSTENLDQQKIFSKEFNIDETNFVRGESVHKIIKDQISYISSKNVKSINFEPAKTNVLIPKLYNQEDQDKITPEHFLNNLDQCLAYAKQIEPYNKEVSRAFLTQNVFNLLPVPPYFWDRFNFNSAEGTKQILNCLEKLNYLSKLYIESMIKEENKLLLPEYKYNFAKMLSIGKYLVKKYAKDILLDDFLNKNDFSLIKYFDLTKDVKSLDPASGIGWEKLKQEQFANVVTKSIYYDNSMFPVPYTVDELKEYHEYSMFLRLYKKIFPVIDFSDIEAEGILKLMKNSPSENLKNEYVKILNSMYSLEPWLPLDEEEPKHNTIYFEQQSDNRLKYVIFSPEGGTIEDVLDIYVDKKLTFEFLRSKKTEILNTLSDRQQLYNKDKSLLLISLIKIVQNFDIINNGYLALEQKPPKDIDVNIEFVMNQIQFLMNNKNSKGEDYELIKNLFNNNLLNDYKYNGKKDKINGQSGVVYNNLKNNQSPLFYDLQVISYAESFQIQLTLLLDYFDSLSENKKNDKLLLDFFKQIILSNIDHTIEQIQTHPLLVDRLVNFFYKEFNRSLTKYKEEDLNEFLNRYVVLQRTAHKIYCFLKESKQQSSHLKILYDGLEKNLAISRSHLFKLLTNGSGVDDIDKGKIATYGLASFNNVSNLTKEDYKMAMIFSSYIGIYGFGKNNNEYDLLLTKDAYDARLKIAEYIQNCNNKQRTELLDFCLSCSVTEDIKPTRPWEEHFPYYFTYDSNNNLIEISLLEGVILKNGVQFINGNIPEDLLRTSLYKKLFGEHPIEVVYKKDSFVPTYLPWQDIEINKSNIFWDHKKYALLDDKVVDNLNLPDVIKKGDFTYWATINDEPTKHNILIVPKNIKNGLNPFLKILPDGKIVKFNGNNNLSLSSIDNTALLKFVENLWVNPKNVLCWQNEQNIITKIEIPVGDKEGNWLSFERNNNDNYWYWTKDPTYFISSKQILNQRPSATNFILLENNRKQQKALFVPLEDVPHNDEFKLNEIHPDAGGSLLVNYIEIDVKQLDNDKAELIGSADVCDLSHLYLAYLNIMQPENDPADGAILLNKQRPLRRYTTSELKMLYRIIDSKNIQEQLKIEQLHPDTAVVRFLALYLLYNNLEKYPFSTKEKESVIKQNSILNNILNEDKLKKLIKDSYNTILQLPKASGRAKISEFISDSELKSLGLSVFRHNETKFIKLPNIKHSDKLLLTEYHLSSEEIKNLDLSLVKNSELLAIKEQQIYEYLNIKPEQIDHLKRKRISGSLYELTIEDAISLYLKQDVSLWKEHTGITDINEIHRIQDEIIKYLLLKVKNQQIQRLLTIQQQLDQLDSSSEAYKILKKTKKQLIDNEKKHVYDPRKYPGILVYEVLSNIMLWPKQITALEKLLLQDQENKYLDQQLEIFMGMGKSKVISPILSYVKADGNHLSLITLTEPLYNSGSSDMQKSLSLLNSQVETIEFSRSKNSLEQIKKLQDQINHAINKGITCTARVKDLQSIDSMPEVFLEEIVQSGIDYNEITKEQIDKIKILIEVNNTIKNQGFFTLDELDTQLYSRQQLNLPIGSEASVSSVGVEVSIELFSMLLTMESIDGVPIKQWLLNNQQTFFSTKYFIEKIKPQLAELVFSKLQLAGNELLNDSNNKELKSYFMSYLGVKDNKKHAELFYNILTKSDPNLANKLAMYKLQLADGKLQESLSKSANTQFGRSKLQPNLEIVIPYAANNLPKESSIQECAFFKDPWETINKTLIYYISSKWNDLNQTERFAIFLATNNSDEKIKNIFGADILESLKANGKKLNSVLPEMMHIIERERKFGNNDLFFLLFDYLKQSVFSEQIKFYPVQASSSSQDFAAQPHRLNGYSGTRFGEKTWHKRIKTDELQHGEQELYEKLLTNSNNCFSNIESADPKKLIAELKTFLNLDKYSSFIDAGALFKGMSNREIATIFLEELTDKKAVAFYDEVTPGVVKLSLITKDSLNKPIVVEGSSPQQIAKALQCSEKDLEKNLFNFYDQAHIIGSDLPNPPQGRAFMTFSEQLGKDLMNQGIMRMRKFKEDNGQRIDFLVNKEVKKIIFRNLGINKPNYAELRLNHLIDHADLVQKNQEKQDYYDAVHQKLQHEIKNHLTKKIRELISSGQLEKALNLYKKIREFILFIDENELFDKYGQLTTMVAPIECLKQKLLNLKEKLILLNEEDKQYDLELNSLMKKLETVVKQVNPKDLPEIVYSNFLSNEGGEASVDISVEQEQQQEQQQQMEQESTNLIPVNLTDKLGKKQDQETYLDCLQAIDFNNSRHVKQANSILLNKIDKELNQEKKYKWQAYNNIIKDNVYYSKDALSVFQQIHKNDGVLTKYGKPVHQVVIVEEQNQPLKLIVVSIEESQNIALAIEKAKKEVGGSGDNLLKNRKIWLVSPNGNALNGTDKWENPFINRDKHAMSVRDLLLQALVLQKNVVVLNEILKNEQDNSDVMRWFNLHQHSIKEIFGKEKFKELTNNVKNIERGAASFSKKLNKITKNYNDNHKITPVISEKNKKKLINRIMSNDNQKRKKL